MTMEAGPGLAVEIHALRKSYGGLRPLRVNRFVVRRGDRVSISGLDAAAAEVLTNLVTGAALPDEGVVRVLGQSTADVSDEQTWLASLDQFGIVTSRAVLLSGSTLAQNLAVPFTLAIEPVPADVLRRVTALAAEVGLAPELLERPIGLAPQDVQARAHLARAVALDPAVLLLEHPTALLPESAQAAFAADLVRLADARRLSVIAITDDRRFAHTIARSRFVLDPATGAVTPARSWWRRGGTSRSS